MVIDNTLQITIKNNSDYTFVVCLGGGGVFDIAKSLDIP